MPLPRTVDVLAAREPITDTVDVAAARPAVVGDLPFDDAPVTAPIDGDAPRRAPGQAPRPDAEPVTFRGASLEEAIALAEQSLGTRIRVVAANRIRRGGIGGFFASDLGVEVSVVLEDETIEDAIERMVAASDADERERWRSRPAVTDPVVADPVVADPVVADPVVADPVTASVAELLEMLTVAPPPAGQTGRVVADDLDRVTDLRAFTAAPRAPEMPVRERIEPAAAAVAAPPVATGSTSLRSPRPEAVRGEVVRERPTPPPTRRQVELAVAATDQLVERLAATPRVKKLSVRVVVRAGDRREVETEAIWEAN